MTDEVAPGVWWLSGTRGCNVYLVRADDGSFVLVDSGFASSASAIVRETRLVAGDAPVTHLLLTHHHGDHSGAAAEVARELGAVLTAGVDDCDRLDGRAWLSAQRMLRPRRLLLRVQRLLRRPSQPQQRVEIKRTLSGTVEVAPGLVAHHVPGHTPGSYCYVAERAGACFVGDLVIGHRSALSRSLAAANNDDGQYSREMLRFTVEGATDLGYPGHGYPRRRFSDALATLAREPREPWTLRNAPGRVWRLAAFMGYMWRKRR